jgi:hypothetical protein
VALQARLHCLGQQSVVGVKKDNKFPARRREPSIARLRQPLVALRDEPDIGRFGSCGIVERSVATITSSRGLCPRAPAIVSALAHSGDHRGGNGCAKITETDPQDNSIRPLSSGLPELATLTATVDPREKCGLGPVVNSTGGGFRRDDFFDS